MYYGYYGGSYILVIIGFILTMFASFGVQATFKRYSSKSASNGITAAMAARRILDANGLGHIRIERVGGNLTDHYSPNENVIRLSDSTYDSSSVAAIGVAAHECGHAVQHKDGYVPIKIRNGIVPIVNISNRLAMPIFVLGLILQGTARHAQSGVGLTLAYIGALLFAMVLLFQVVTLPCELNASSRAMKTIRDMDLLYGDELVGARKVLTAAAMTYVAAVASTALQFLRLLIILNNNRRRD
ncbi:MAG: zinc metallopeptidase [Clostridiales bacterium]|nr:zinc metallopeptidase [Clostridiales bacterium]